MRRTLALALAVSFSITGCGGDSKPQTPVSTEFNYSGTIPSPVKFVLPAGGETLAARTTVNQARDKGVITPLPFQHPKSWAVYMAASMYTDGRTPRSERWVTDMVHMQAINKFLVSNGLRDQFILGWVQYDPIPPGQGALANKVDAGWDFMPLPFRWQDANEYFDYYIVSPSSRYGAPGLVRYDKWVKPYLWYEDSRDGRIKRDIDKEAGIDDYKSKVWDKWNRHFFLVNPDGYVVDSWVSVGSTVLNAFPNGVMSAIAKRFELDPSKVVYPTVNYDGVYFSEYKPSLEQQGLDVVTDVKEKMSDR